jgi:hypothetical protein
MRLENQRLHPNPLDHKRSVLDLPRYHRSRLMNNTLDNWLNTMVVVGERDLVTIAEEHSLVDNKLVLGEPSHQNQSEVSSMMTCQLLRRT